MDEIYLEAFLAVVRYGTIKDASLHLDVAPSTITTRLQLLERRLEATLIDRSRGRSRTALTPEGEEFLELAERWETIASEMTAVARHGDATLVVGAPDSVSHYLLAPIYAELAFRCPEISLKIVTANSAELYGKIETREVDIAFVLYDRFLPGVRIHQFISEPMLVITGGCAACGADGTIDIVSLEPAEQVHIPWGAAIERWNTGRSNLHAGTIWIDTAHLIRAFLADERKWAIVPQSMADAMRTESSYNIYQLTDPPPNRIVFEARRVRLSQLSLRGCELFDEAVRKLLPEAQVC